MDEAFHRDPYSKSFIALRYLGQWNGDGFSPRKQRFFLIYRILMLLNNIEISSLGVIHLYLSIGDVKKAAFNLCTTILSCAITIKNFHIMLLSRRIDRLRLKIYKYITMCQEPEDLAIKQHFFGYLILVGKVFLVFAIISWPLWLVTSLTSLKWGPRELPFPVYYPFDINNDFHFCLGFAHHVLSSMYVVAEVVFADLAMFSLMLSLSTLYKILAKNIKKLDNLFKDRNPEEIYGSDGKTKHYLKIQTKEILRECVTKQMELMACLKELEYFYNIPMMIQLIAGLLLSIGNGLELIVVSLNFSIKLLYQLGYTIIVLGDVFMVCYLADLLVSQIEQFKTTLYEISWYNMDSDIRKDLLLITIGAQKIIPMTAGKMFKLTLPTFLGLCKNVYSWLAMFRQVVMKK